MSLALPHCPRSYINTRFHGRYDILSEYVCTTYKQPRIPNPIQMAPLKQKCNATQLTHRTVQVLIGQVIEESHALCVVSAWPTGNENIYTENLIHNLSKFIIICLSYGRRLSGPILVHSVYITLFRRYGSDNHQLVSIHSHLGGPL